MVAMSAIRARVGPVGRHREQRVVGREDQQRPDVREHEDDDRRAEDAVVVDAPPAARGQQGLDRERADRERGARRRGHEQPRLAREVVAGQGQDGGRQGEDATRPAGPIRLIDARA
jgi:hypothetical protein